MKLGSMNLTVKDLPKVILFVAGYAAIIGLALNFSWISLSLMFLLASSSVIWVMSIKLRRRTCQRVFKYMLVGMFICVISFSAFQNYLYRNAGYPPTFNPAQPDVIISYPNILNTSIVDIIQGIRNTPAFSLLSLEFPGENTVILINLDTRAPGIDSGSILVRFDHASKVDIAFRSDRGNPYEVRTIIWSRVWPTYVQSKTVDESLQQIDELGLQWFYDRAIEEHQNKTGKTPEITGLEVIIRWDEYKTYQGLTLQVTCYYGDSKTIPPTAFTAYFQPDGTLLYTTN
jgi:hypothetical protein